MKKTPEIEVSYFFKKVGNTVYRFIRYGKGKWIKEKIPFNQEPYIYFGNYPLITGKIGDDKE